MNILMLSYLLSSAAFAKSSSYIIISLLLLEMMIIVLFLNLLIFVNNMNCYKSSIMFIFLIMFACESVLGLSIMIIMVRKTGTDLNLLTNMIKC
uniref:NADH dehydrogenase subunit 4L n=1 Tax=Spelaeomysis bottazzii TaxID=2970448 RepID=UPI002176CD7D|nr:NADH dehydrogenase subunit 4L [Spelaeomysis bottazzii]UUL70730.1 NADH dehydrogenase subunit 4L [Spelaeomysis bottazzii]